MNILEKIIEDAKTVPKTLRYKLTHRMELTKEELEEVYNSNSPAAAYLCAEGNPGANIAKLEEVVLSSPYWSYCFARNIPKANIAKLEYSCWFALYVPGANIAKLEDGVLSDPWSWSKYI